MKMSTKSIIKGGLSLAALVAGGLVVNHANENDYGKRKVIKMVAGGTGALLGLAGLVYTIDENLKPEVNEEDEKFDTEEDYGEDVEDDFFKDLEDELMDEEDKEVDDCGDEDDDTQVVTTEEVVEELFHSEPKVVLDSVVEEKLEQE